MTNLTSENHCIKSVEEGAKKKGVPGHREKPSFSVLGQLGLPFMTTETNHSDSNVEWSLSVDYMYIGVSCPVRSLNMAAGIVFM